MLLQLSPEFVHSVRASVSNIFLCLPQADDFHQLRFVLRCRKGMVYFQVRKELEVTAPTGTVGSCGLISDMLAPEENDSEVCVTTQDALFSQCCYEQCSLCDGQGLKWWIEFEDDTVESGRKIQEMIDSSPFPTDRKSFKGAAEDRESSGSTVSRHSIERKLDTDQPTYFPTVMQDKTCSSFSASLHTDLVEANDDQCLETKSEYSSECCYSFPTHPCGLCKQGDVTQTLLWSNEIMQDGQNISCGIINNILNTEEEGSAICADAKETHFDDCCFDKCSLCGSKQLAWDFVIEYYDDQIKSCGDIEAIFAANKVEANSDDCSSTKADFEDLCCFTPPSSPCELCSEYVRWDEAVEFDNEKSTCKDAIALLKREEELSDQCLTAKEVRYES